jgi:NAD(P)-dependent dehydrogenase (short-subunit alcohol dehydrogenase family)
MKYLNKLKSKRVIVLGGTSGIGFAVAEAAVEYGATVFISSSTTEKLERSLARLRASYPDASKRIDGYTCNLSNKDDLESNLEVLLKTATNDGTNKLDHVVFTAGDNFRATIQDFSKAQPDDIYKMMTVRGIAPAMIAKLLPKYIHISPESSFTLTGGTLMTKPMPGFSLPLLALGGIEPMVRGLALDMKPLRVNLVAPGTIQTELTESLPDHVKEHFRGKTLSGLLGQPEDTAEAYLYIMKDHFITGTIIHTNGGVLLI